MTYQPPFYKKIFHDTRRFLAKYWLISQPVLQIGITGSQGKTNTTQTLYKLLSSAAPTVVTDTNLDTIYNVPITALQVKPNTAFGVFELGVDHRGEMDYHLEIVRPRIGVITGISPVHTDEEHFGSLENLIKEKRKLTEALPSDGYAILNFDDANVKSMAAFTKAQILGYGTNQKTCAISVHPASVHVSLDGTKFNLQYERRNYTVQLKLIGIHHIYTVMASLLTSLVALKMIGKESKIQNLIHIIESQSPLRGRMSVEIGPHQTMVLNDALRANPSSTAAGLTTLSAIHYPKGKKIAILAEMGELENPEEEHRTIGKLLKTLKLDYVIGIGPKQKFVIEEYGSKNSHYATDVYDAAHALKTILKKGDLIYLKGSLYRHVERVLQIIEGKKPPADLVLEAPSV